MARIELRDCTVYIKDGLGAHPDIYPCTALGNKTVSPDKAAVAVGDTGCKVTTVSIPTAVAGKTQKVPVGARFTIAGETAATVHVVTARTQDGTNVDVTTDITFSPALGAGTYAVDAAITFLSQQLEVKIGEGNITYTEKSDYTYLLDRDNLDTVKEGKDVPLDIKWDSVYEFITTGTSEEITPMDALKGIGGASEWITYSKDPCEPYAVAIEVQQVPPCSTAESESTLFPDFRSEQREVNFKDATIAVTGKCNVTQPIVTRMG
jgi:uncharacterized protein YxjI